MALRQCYNRRPCVLRDIVERGCVNRTEALNILGLDDDASPADIKSAYRECVQILHPDRFANNKKLQDRATEQFKRLQDAYDYLTSSRAAKSSSASSSRPRSAYSSREAKIAGLDAARVQLVAQRDALADERRNAIIMIAAGAIVALFLRRIVWAAGLAGTLVIWGIVTLAGACRNIQTLDEHLGEIEMQKRQLEENWEEE